MTTAVLALPEDALGCEFCGCALIPGETRGEVVEVPSLPPDRIAVRSWRGSAERFARCADCQAITDRAEAYLADHEQWAASVGRYIATERVVSSLTALAILGRDIADKDLGLMLPRLWPPAHQLHFASTFAARPTGHANPEPWSHVTPADRDALRKAYAGGLRDRIALHEPAVPIPCPSRTCLMCGVSSVSRSAIEVSQRGGVAPTIPAVWRLVEAGGAVGAGHLCPDCALAVDEAGAIGATAVQRAVMAHVKVTYPNPQRWGGIRGRIEDEEVRVRTWAAAGGGRPNLFPWAHASKLLDI